MARLPAGNIEWNKIPANAKVQDRGTCFVAIYKVGGKTKKAVAFWGSLDAVQAQRTLAARAKR